MEPIQCKETFHPVGQGMFYTARIDWERGHYCIVYDCGTVSRKTFLNDEIKALSNDETNIDLLVISHLDADHVNGISTLLDKVSVKTVMLPYLSPIERLFLCATMPEQRHNSFYEFLADPLAYLSAANVQQVIVVGREGDFPERDGGDSVNQPFDEPVHPNIVPAPSLGEFVQREEGRSYTKTHYVDYTTTLSVDTIWEFKFYVPPVERVDLDAFADHLKGEVEISSVQQKIEAIKDTDARKQLRDAYRRIRSDVNLTSLCLYHGPCHFEQLDGETACSINMYLSPARLSQANESPVQATLDT